MEKGFFSKGNSTCKGKGVEMWWYVGKIEFLRVEYGGGGECYEYLVFFDFGKGFLR